MSLFVQVVVNGILIGAIYSLIALGYSIIFSTMRMGHFAQGDFFMFGAFVGYQFLVKWEQNLLIAFVMAIIGTSVLMLIAERLTYRPMYSRPGIGLMISTMGMQYIVQWAAKLIWGTEPKKMPPLFGTEDVIYEVKMFGGEVRINNNDVMIFLICIGLMLALAIFMKYTKIGMAMSAVSMNRKAAQLMGIKLTTIISSTFIMAAAMAAVSGMLLTPHYSVVFNVAIGPGARAMTSAVLGGFGSMPGAMLGGILMGIIEMLGSFYVTTTYRDAFTFVVLIAVLFWRPQGILGRRSITKV